MSRTRPIHIGKKGFKKLWPIMSAEERRQRNGDKRTLAGYSSSGVKLPDKEDLREYHEVRQRTRNGTGLGNIDVNPNKLVVSQNMGHKK